MYWAGVCTRGNRRMTASLSCTLSMQICDHVQQIRETRIAACGLAGHRPGQDMARQAASSGARAMLRPLVIAYHLIWTGYGRWLPNDPRGSGSIKVLAAVIAELGAL